MREPFVRPFFAKFFYILAGLGGIIATLLLLLELTGAYRVLGNKWAMLLTAWGVLAIVYLWACALSLAAVGYVIELLAKIEWNTRPQEWATGGMYAAPRAATGEKLYYYIDKGPLVGPLSAPDLLNLVRDGKLSIATRYFVEENGQRRPLANLSEINL